MGFGVDKTDPAFGLVSATSVPNPDVKITVTIRVGGSGRTVVRADGNRYREAVSEPEAYQQFFADLSQTLALPSLPVPAGSLSKDNK